MKVKATAVYSGPSIFSQAPVVRFSFGKLPSPADWPPGSALLDGIVKYLPELGQHAGPCGAPRSLASRDVGPGAAPFHLFEHLCIALQNRAGAELGCVRTTAGGHPGEDGALVPHEEAEVCIEAAQLACEMMTSLVAGISQAADAASGEFDFGTRLQAFLRSAAGIMLPIQDRMLVSKARAIGIPVARLVGRTIVLGQGCRQRRVSGTKTDLTNIVGNDLAANKDYSRRVLREFGLPVPRYERVHRLRDAVLAADRIGYPVVVKPNDGNMGRGVSVRMTNRREVRDAYRLARTVSRSVLVEELVEGDDHRIVVINGRFCAATRRIPGRVVGDGEHTIEELVEEVNRDPRRAPGHTASWTTIRMDEQADRLIAEIGYTRESIPPKGQWVYLRRISNASAGGTDADVTDEVHPDNQAIAIRAAQAIGLDVAGVDILTRDISAPIWSNGGMIGEINTKPDLRKHLWPAAGKPRDVIAPIIDMLFPDGGPARVPVVAIVGTGITAVVAGLLAHILEAAGRRVGLAMEGKVCIGGGGARGGELPLPVAMRRILLDPAIEVAVFEISPEQVIRHGLGCDSLDVVAIVNGGAAGPGEGATGRSTEACDEAVRLVTRMARRIVYVTESSGFAPVVASAGPGVDMCPVVIGDGGSRRGARRAPSGGRLVVRDGDSIAIHGAGRRPLRFPLAELPDRGAEPGMSEAVDGVSCAILAALSLGEQYGDICAALASFAAGPAPELGSAGAGQGKKPSRGGSGPAQRPAGRR